MPHQRGVWRSLVKAFGKPGCRLVLGQPGETRRRARRIEWDGGLLLRAYVPPVPFLLKSSKSWDDDRRDRAGLYRGMSSCKYSGTVLATISCVWPRDFRCVPPVWNLRAVIVWSHFSISPILFFCLVLSLFLSYPFMLLAHSPDLLFPPFSER